MSSLSAGVSLFNILCGLVPCDPKYDTPEIRAVPLNPQDVVRNQLVRGIEPIVQLPNGGVEGYIMTASEGRDFFAFEGIPYGEAERWKSPTPKRPWRGIRSAKKPGPDCLQLSMTRMLRTYGSEDCLTINVFSPLIPTPYEESRTFPVVVFLHGGSFMFGSGQEYGPSYMLNEDVILVTLNYRLGVLGFLSTGDDVLPGNNGLHDQALALKWIHENIQYFGGNPNNVTLMGNSAGATSVQLHMISKKTRNYFSTAYSSSGTGFNFWAVQNGQRMKELTNRLARQFGCQNEDSYALVKCLRKIDASTLVSAQINMFEWFPFPPVLFSPTVEKDSPDAFLTIWPEEAYKRGDVAEKPYIVGVTKDEGMSSLLVLLPFMRTFPLRMMWDQIAPYFLQYKNTDHPEETTKRISEFYLKGVNPRLADLEVFADMITDRYISLGTIKGLQAHKASTSAPCYLYYFSFSEGNHNLANIVGRKSKEWGAGHVEDMYYYFNSSVIVNGQKLSDPDRELGSIMIKLLVNFAATGVPSYTSETGEVFQIWKPVNDLSKLKALQFDRAVEMIDFPAVNVDRLNFWTTLGLPNATLWSPLTATYQRKIKLKLSNYLK